MNKQIALILVAALTLPMMTGCANGLFRNWLRGDSCDTCNPPAAHPTMFSGCASGTCGSGLVSAPAPVTGGQGVVSTTNQGYTDPYSSLVPNNPGPMQ